MADEQAPRLGSRVFWGAVVVGALPIAIAALRAIERGRIPLGDNALMEIRGRDVFTQHHPLLGTASSASLSAGNELNHPGPLLFDAVALPARIFGGAAGTAIAVAVVNILSVIGVALVARRRGGVLLGTAAAAMVATLCWTMGSEVLYEPWNPHSVVLPFLLFLTLVWSASCGDLVALPWAVAAGSLVLQTHLSYSLLVPILGAWAVVGLLLALRRTRRDEPDRWPDERRWMQRVGLITAGVALGVLDPADHRAAHVRRPGQPQPVVRRDDVVARLHDRVWHGCATGGVGRDDTAVLVPAVVQRFVPPGTRWTAPSSLAAAVGLLVLAVILGACAWDARRRRDITVTFAVATSVVGVVAGVLTAGGAPVGVFGRATPHVLRWMWPLAAFITLTIVAEVVRRFATAPERAAACSGRSARSRVVFAVLAVPTSNQSTGPNSQQWAIESFEELRPQLDALEGKGPLLVDGLFEEVFDPYGGAIVAELQARGVDFVARSATLERQFGPDRRLADSDARFAVYVRTGDSAIEGLPGTEEVAFVEGLDACQTEQLERAEQAVAAELERRVRLTAEGRAALRNRDLPLLREQREAGQLDVAALIASGEVLRMVEEGWVSISDGRTCRGLRALGRARTRAATSDGCGAARAGRLRALTHSRPERVERDGREHDQ